MKQEDFYRGITFDDVLLEPQYSEIVPSEVSTKSVLTSNISLGIPIVSAAMDTVTTSTLAICIAQEGGIGIIHKNLSIEEQAREVLKVKRSANGVIQNPVTLPPSSNVGEAKDAMRVNNISGIPITGESGKVVGIVTRRDLEFQEDLNVHIDDIMTRKLVTGGIETDLVQAKRILTSNKIEKLVLIAKDGSLVGLITMKDIYKYEQFPRAARDERGRLRVGAAVGVFDFERAEALVNAGVDILVVDSAHGHSKNIAETVKGLKKMFPIDIIAGNVATKEGARFILDSGADAVKVGIGPGSICTTRVIAGIGVPQLSAIFNALRGTEGKIPIIADGGIKYSGDIVKALAAGANSVMIGSLFAGTNESPGETIYFRGRSFKNYRGMGSMGAMVLGSADRYSQKGTARKKLVPEGIEGRVPAKGPLADYVYQLVGGLKAGMGYVGAKSIPDLKERARFIKISQASYIESHPHDITITKGSPNYRQDEGM